MTVALPSYMWLWFNLNASFSIDIDYIVSYDDIEIIIFCYFNFHLWRLKQLSEEWWLQTKHRSARDSFE